MARPTMHRGKTLLGHIDSEERKKIEASRPYKMPDYRTGDVMTVTMFNSLSEGKFQTHTGVVIGNAKRNNLRHSFSIHSVSLDVNFTYDIKAHSPLVAKVEMFRMGSNKNRKKLNHIPKLDLTIARCQEPIIKGRNFKKRGEKVDKTRRTT